MLSCTEQAISAPWTKRYNGPAINPKDYAYAIAVDSSGNVYVTGRSSGLDTGSDFATIKYDADGVEQWVRRYDGPRHSLDEAVAIAVDESGNVYVTGKSAGSGTKYDFVTIKYDTNGFDQWVRRYNGLGNDCDEARAIALDSSGNVFVTGSSQVSDFNNDYTTIKYDNDGVQQWVRRYNGPGNDYDEAFAIAVDDAGNIYVTGFSAGSSTYLDYATIKYNTNGVEQWVRHYNGPGNRNDIASAITLDNFGNVYVTGRSIGSVASYDYATIKYDTDGVEQWVRRYNGPGNYYDFAEAIVLDNFGNVYITGHSRGSDISYDYATIKYNTDGIEQWVRRYNGSGNDWDEAHAIAVDGFGNVYVTGHSTGSSTYTDYTTIRYNTDGVERWVRRYNGSGNNTDIASAITLDSFGNVYVTGRSKGSGTTGTGYLTIKYCNE